MSIHLCKLVELEPIWRLEIPCVCIVYRHGNCSWRVPFNVSGLCNLGTDTLQKPRDKIAWVSATLHGWLKALLF